VKRILILPVFAAMLGATCASASDLNPLGIYAGAAAGPSYDSYTQLGADQDTGTGWKVSAGLRPVPFLGAELEYIDFGSARFSTASGPLGGGFKGQAHATAEGLFAVGYLPIPISAVDVFAKLGAEHVRTSADGIGEVGPVTCGLECILPTHVRDSDTAIAYGAGVQWRLRSLALRAEYERADTGLGHPALLSFGINWTF